MLLLQRAALIQRLCIRFFHNLIFCRLSPICLVLFVVYLLPTLSFGVISLITGDSAILVLIGYDAIGDDSAVTQPR
ncbi:hypothetical protein BDR03DRAFT_975404 [Suillus americanus]|nr:hypothetical protein BDR03DRAFT_975404 [Suillus americanus]